VIDHAENAAWKIIRARPEAWFGVMQKGLIIHSMGLELTPRSPDAFSAAGGNHGYRLGTMDLAMFGYAIRLHSRVAGRLGRDGQNRVGGGRR
jgi:hypothetical protein